MIVIGGATATGKTAVAIALARHFNTEILSADSRQFFREMSIGTAKPSQAELSAARHHFIDSLSVTSDYSVGDFERDAMTVLSDIFRKKDIALLVGGSGLYLRAVYEGLDEFPEVPAHIRDQVERGYAEKGLAWLQESLQQLDNEYFAKVDRHNPARMKRALEVTLTAGKPFSSFLKKEKTARPFNSRLLLMELPRTELYARIDRRVDDMLEAGLEEEARRLLPFRHKAALNTVGYQEFFQYFDGNISYEMAIEKIKQHSRNYAKRQATWFRKHGVWHAFHPANIPEITAFIEKA